MQDKYKRYWDNLTVRFKELEAENAELKERIEELEAENKKLKAFLYKIKKADEPWSMEDLKELLGK